MPLSTDSPLRLAIIDDSAEHAENLVSSLRNAGMVVRPQRVTAIGELSEMLRTQPLDIVLASHDSLTCPPLHAALAVADSGKDIPVLLMVETLSEDELISAHANGFRSIALRKRPEHVIAKVRSTFDDLHTRRALRRLELQMRETERRCDALIASSRDPIAYIHEGMHIRANEAYLEMFGFEDVEEIEGIALLDMVAPGHVDDFKTLLRSLSKGDAPPAQYSLDMLRADGERISATMDFSSATYEGEHCLQVVFRRQEVIDPQLVLEMEALRQRDPATGLLNRATMMARIDDALVDVTRPDGQQVFLLVQPDHAARLLPEIGLESADALAAALARQVENATGEDASVARMGELVFGILASADWARANALAEMVVAEFRDHVIGLGTQSLSVTVSVGGVLIGERITSPSMVLQRANESLGATNALGGNSHLVHDPAAVDRVEQERAKRWLLRLRQAIASDDFVLHYQPILNLAGDPQQRYDAFLRLDNDGELVPPSSFIAIAEENGLMREINRCIARLAIQRIGQRRSEGHETHVGIRISPETFDDPEFIAIVRDQLAACGVKGEQLHLQIAESRVYTHLRAAQQFQRNLGALGCQLVLDQFGNGLDSFQLLGHIRPAAIKLDRSFTADFNSLRDQHDKVEEITRRAAELDITTIAEFIQDAPSMSLLYSAGVAFVQGDFVGPAQLAMDYEFA